MIKKELASIFAAPFASLTKEGRFARKLLWKHGKAVIFFTAWNDIRDLATKIVKIAILGAVFSMFQESTVIDFIKEHWMVALVGICIYAVAMKYLQAHQDYVRKKAHMVIDLEIKKLISTKTSMIGLGTRLSSQFRQKLRGAKRCSSYDVNCVGLWPIEVISTTIASIIFFIGLAWLSWKISALFLGTAILVAVGASWVSRWVRAKEREMEEDEEKASEYHPASLSIDSTLLGTSSFLFGRSVEMYTALLKQQLTFQRKAMVTGTLIGGLVFIAVGIELYFLRDSLFKEMSFTKLGITISTMFMAIGSFVQMMRAIFSEQQSIQDITELRSFLEYTDEEETRCDKSFPMPANAEVRVEHIDFAYPYLENAPLIIKDLSLELHPGEAVVIVGANGSGKTTLGKIIANVYRPQRGTVFYGNTVVNDRSTRSCFEHALMIPQSGDLHEIKLCESLFARTELESMSVEETSRYFEAIRLSGAKEVLDTLPDNIHTQIGTAFKGGTNLSGGQEQRLRLAAFFFKALHPSIRMVIADEPSRFLDPRIRNQVYDSLISMARDRSKIVVVISHDAELEKFDRVIVIDQGKISGDYTGEEEIQKAISTVARKLAADSLVTKASE
jgi:ABC-type bacteriocin/lantibiotic exporter with double-glycine peptidase domain